MINANRLVPVIGLVLAAANSSRTDIGVIVLEALGFWTRVGHAATYLSNICQDGSPIRMRVCRPGERGGVVRKYTPISANEDYDWAIVPENPNPPNHPSTFCAPWAKKTTPRTSLIIAVPMLSSVETMSRIMCSLQMYLRCRPALTPAAAVPG